MDLNDFPPVSEALLLCLERRFNCGPPSKSESIQSLMTRAGHAEVISYLRTIKDKQNTGASKESTDVLFESKDTGSSTSSPSATRRRARRSGEW